MQVSFSIRENLKPKHVRGLRTPNPKETRRVVTTILQHKE